MTERRRDEDQRTHAGRLADHAIALSARVVATTFPIYQADDQGRPDALGSGVLLHLGGTRFVLTATHVARVARVRQVAVATGEMLAPLTGPRVEIFREGTTLPNEDDVDVTAIRVSGDIWSTVSNEAFLSWDELDHSVPVLSRDAFGLAGYPVSKQRGLRRGDQLPALMYQVVAKESRGEGYLAARRNPHSSLMVGFEKRKVWGPEGRSTAPDMFGMSGSGVWRFGPNLLSATVAPKLAGIVVEWVARGRHQHILATRIQSIVAGLANSHEDVASFIQSQSPSGSLRHT